MVVHTWLDIDGSLLRSSCVCSQWMLCKWVVVVRDPTVDGSRQLPCQLDCFAELLWWVQPYLKTPQPQISSDEDRATRSNTPTSLEWTVRSTLEAVPCRALAWQTIVTASGSSLTSDLCGTTRHEVRCGTVGSSTSASAVPRNPLLNCPMIIAKDR